MAESKTRVFSLKVTLLEDLHTGSGMGSAVVDRLLARAPDGTPVITAEHVKGVWRDNALRLRKLGHITDDEITNLFGATGGQRGCLLAPELRPRSDTPVTSLYWDATARKAGQRAPDDHSLRRTEYLPANTILEGQGRLTEGDDTLWKAFECIVRFTNALGSERTRGSGLIRAELVPLQSDQVRHDSTFAPVAQPAPDLSGGIRLLLHADAPVCIPTTGSPGNIIPSEHYIPGRTLFGAIARACIDRGTKPAVLFDRRLGIGPGYPLPAVEDCKDATVLRQIEVLPMPLNLWSPKPLPREQRLWPYWLPQTKKDQKAQVNAPAFRDMLLPEDEQATKESWRPDKTRYKRPRDNAYLFRACGGAWQAFESRLGLRMRNRRGDPLRHDVPETEADLFTVEQMPTGTRFVADIRPLHPGDSDAVPALAQLLGIGADSTGPTALRVGRGGARVNILGWCPLASSDAPNEDEGKGKRSTLTVTLLTDLIARSPDLRFHTQLTVGAIRDALGSASSPSVAGNGDETRVFSDNLPYRSFNAVSGLPAAGRVAIRRGSVLQVSGPLAVELAKALSRRQAIGEQTWEGNGRFALDLPMDANAVTRIEVKIPGAAASTAGDPARVDKVIRTAEVLIGDGKSLAWLPSRAQLGNLRAWLASTGDTLAEDDFRKRIESFKADVGQRRAGSDWRGAFDTIHLADKLADACCQDGTCHTEYAELFLRVLGLHKSKQEDTEEPQQ